MLPSLAQVESLFTTPAFAAAGAAAVAVPIVIHLLSRARRKREPWGAMRWLMEAYRKQQKRAKLEHLLLLLLRCLAVLVLGLALAGPQLAGSLRALAGGAGGTGREFVIVLNDAVTSGVRDVEGQARLDRFREALGPVLRGSGRDDRFTLITAARPARMRIEGVRGPAALRRGLEQLEPIAARPDLGGALDLAARRLDATAVPAGRAQVLVLDDWATADDRSQDELPGSLADLGERAEVRVLPPAPSTANVQIASLEPRRTTFVPGPSAAVLPVNVTLRRFVDTQPTRRSVTLGLGPPGEDPASEQSREASFAQGQRELTVGFEIETPAINELRGRQHWMLRAEIEPGASNAVRPDDVRLRWVEIKPAFRVALVGGEGTGGAGEWSPARWLSIGLNPQREGRGAFAVRRVRPVSFDTEALENLDAVFVLSPDRLPPAAWAVLGDAVREGLALWVWPAAEQGRDVASHEGWFEFLAEAMDLPWTLAAEPFESQGAGVRLDESRPAPAALSLLGADWDDLLRPIRVFRRWPVDGYVDEELWLATADREPLLLARGVGRGGVLLSTAAADTNWTNLPAKPLLVPLLHEAIRAVAGGDPLPRRAAFQPVSVGDAMPEGEWENVFSPEVDPLDIDPSPGEREGPSAQEANMPEPAASGEPGGPTAPPRAFERVGLYRLSEDPEGGATPSVEPDDADVGNAERQEVQAVQEAQDEQDAGEVAASRRYLAVNADAPAGNTAALSRRAISRWLDPLGPWTFVEADELSAASEQAGPRVNLAWPLLWALLVLVVGETLLSRAFSHASTGGGAKGLAGQLWQRLLNPRSESKGRAGA